MRLLRTIGLVSALALFLLGAGGCASTRVDWGARVGSYTYDDAVRELGPPDKSAKLSDETLVADWLTGRGMRTATTFGPGFGVYGPHGFGRYGYGYVGPQMVIMDPPSPDRFLRLTFDPQGKLASWQQVFK